MNKLIIASNNMHKVEEIKAILEPYFKEILSLKKAGIEIDVEETGETFYDNALLKAKAVSQIANCVVLSDDSGLMVNALDGLPGVRSARFAGEPCNDLENNYKLLKLMDKISDRYCKFVSDVVLYYPDGKILNGHGECEGTLLRYFDGNGGFGYDPLFYCTELKKSFSAASFKEKNKVSHRYRALMELIKIL